MFKESGAAARAVDRASVDDHLEPGAEISLLLIDKAANQSLVHVKFTGCGALWII